MTLEELKERRDKVQAAIDNILEAGQEFQTRASRVKFANLNTLYDELHNLDNAIAAAEAQGGTNTTYLQFGGFE